MLPVGLDTSSKRLFPEKRFQIIHHIEYVMRKNLKVSFVQVTFILKIFQCENFFLIVKFESMASGDYAKISRLIDVMKRK